MPPPTKYSRAEIAEMMRQVGWDEKYIPTMSAVFMGESSGNPRIENPNKHIEESIGLAQINLKGKNRYRYKRYGIKSPEDLKDPIFNLKVAKRLFDEEGGAKHWTVWNEGTYRNFMTPEEQDLLPSAKGRNRPAKGDARFSLQASVGTVPKQVTLTSSQAPAQQTQTNQTQAKTPNGGAPPPTAVPPPTERPRLRGMSSERVEPDVQFRSPEPPQFVQDAQGNWTQAPAAPPRGTNLPQEPKPEEAAPGFKPTTLAPGDDGFALPPMLPTLTQRPTITAPIQQAPTPPPTPPPTTQMPVGTPQQDAAVLDRAMGLLGGTPITTGPYRSGGQAATLPAAPPATPAPATAPSTAGNVPAPTPPTTTAPVTMETPQQQLEPYQVGVPKTQTTPPPVVGGTQIPGATVVGDITGTTNVETPVGGEADTTVRPIKQDGSYERGGYNYNKKDIVVSDPQLTVLGTGPEYQKYDNPLFQNPEYVAVAEKLFLNPDEIVSTISPALYRDNPDFKAFVNALAEAKVTQGSTTKKLDPTNPSGNPADYVGFSPQRLAAVLRGLYLNNQANKIADPQEQAKLRKLGLSTVAQAIQEHNAEFDEISDAMLAEEDTTLLITKETGEAREQKLKELAARDPQRRKQIALEMEARIYSQLSDKEAKEAFEKGYKSDAFAAGMTEQMAATIDSLNLFSRLGAALGSTDARKNYFLNRKKANEYREYARGYQQAAADRGEETLGMVKTTIAGVPIMISRIGVYTAIARYGGRMGPRAGGMVAFGYDLGSQAAGKGETGGVIAKEFAKGVALQGAFEVAGIVRSGILAKLLGGKADKVLATKTNSELAKIIKDSRKAQKAGEKFNQVIMDLIESNQLAPNSWLARTLTRRFGKNAQPQRQGTSVLKGTGERIVGEGGKVPTRQEMGDFVLQELRKQLTNDEIIQLARGSEKVLDKITRLLIGGGTMIGVLGAGTYGVEKGFGATNEEATMSALSNVLMHYGFLGIGKGAQAGYKVAKPAVGKVFRVFSPDRSEFRDVTIEADGTVRDHGQLPESAVDVTIVPDDTGTPADGTAPPRPESPFKEGDTVTSADGTQTGTIKFDAQRNQYYVETTEPDGTTRQFATGGGWKLAEPPAAPGAAPQESGAATTGGEGAATPPAPTRPAMQAGDTVTRTAADGTVQTGILKADEDGTLFVSFKKGKTEMRSPVTGWKRPAPGVGEQVVRRNPDGTVETGTIVTTQTGSPVVEFTRNGETKRGSVDGWVRPEELPPTKPRETAPPATTGQEGGDVFGEGGIREEGGQPTGAAPTGNPLAPFGGNAPARGEAATPLDGKALAAAIPKETDIPEGGAIPSGPKGQQLQTFKQRFQRIYESLFGDKDPESRSAGLIEEYNGVAKLYNQLINRINELTGGKRGADVELDAQTRAAVDNLTQENRYAIQRAAMQKGATLESVAKQFKTTPEVVEGVMRRTLEKMRGTLDDLAAAGRQRLDDLEALRQGRAPKRQRAQEESQGQGRDATEGVTDLLDEGDITPSGAPKPAGRFVIEEGGAPAKPGDKVYRMVGDGTWQEGTVMPDGKTVEYSQVSSRKVTEPLSGKWKRKETGKKKNQQDQEIKVGDTVVTTIKTADGPREVTGKVVQGVGKELAVEYTASRGGKKTESLAPEVGDSVTRTLPDGTVQTGRVVPGPRGTLKGKTIGTRPVRTTAPRVALDVPPGTKPKYALLDGNWKKTNEWSTNKPRPEGEGGTKAAEGVADTTPRPGDTVTKRVANRGGGTRDITGKVVEGPNGELLVEVPNKTGVTRTEKLSDKWKLKERAKEEGATTGKGGFAEGVERGKAVIAAVKLFETDPKAGAKKLQELGLTPEQIAKETGKSVDEINKLLEPEAKTGPTGTPPERPTPPIADGEGGGISPEVQKAVDDLDPNIKAEIRARLDESREGGPQTPAEVAKALGVPLAVVEAIPRKGDVGPFGQIAMVVRDAIEDANSAFGEALAKVIAPLANFGNRAQAANVVMDALAALVGRGRASRVGQEEWSTIVKDLVNRGLPVEHALKIIEGMKYQTKYSKAINDLLIDGEFRRAIQQMVKAGIRRLDDAPPEVQAAIYKAAKRIGDEYGNRKAKSGEIADLFTPDAIKRAVDDGLAGRDRPFFEEALPLERTRGDFTPEQTAKAEALTRKADEIRTSRGSRSPSGVVKGQDIDGSRATGFGVSLIRDIGRAAGRLYFKYVAGTTSLKDWRLMSYRAYRDFYDIVDAGLAKGSRVNGVPVKLFGGMSWTLSADGVIRGNAQTIATLARVTLGSWKGAQGAHVSTSGGPIQAVIQLKLYAQQASDAGFKAEAKLLRQLAADVQTAVESSPYRDFIFSMDAPKSKRFWDFVHQEELFHREDVRMRAYIGSMGTAKFKDGLDVNTFTAMPVYRKVVAALKQRGYTVSNAKANVEEMIAKALRDDGHFELGISKKEQREIINAYAKGLIDQGVTPLDVLGSFATKSNRGMELFRYVTENYAQRLDKTKGGSKYKAAVEAIDRALAEQGRGGRQGEFDPVDAGISTLGKRGAELFGRAADKPADAVPVRTVKKVNGKTEVVYTTPKLKDRKVERVERDGNTYLRSPNHREVMLTPDEVVAIQAMPERLRPAMEDAIYLASVADDPITFKYKGKDVTIFPNEDLDIPLVRASRGRRPPSKGTREFSLRSQGAAKKAVILASEPIAMMKGTASIFDMSFYRQAQDLLLQMPRRVKEFNELGKAVEAQNNDIRANLARLDDTIDSLETKLASKDKDAMDEIALLGGQAGVTKRLGELQAERTALTNDIRTFTDNMIQRKRHDLVFSLMGTGLSSLFGSGADAWAMVGGTAGFFAGGVPGALVGGTAGAVAGKAFQKAVVPRLPQAVRMRLGTNNLREIMRNHPNFDDAVTVGDLQFGQARPARVGERVTDGWNVGTVSKERNPITGLDEVKVRKSDGSMVDMDGSWELFGEATGSTFERSPSRFFSGAPVFESKYGQRTFAKALASKEAANITDFILNRSRHYAITPWRVWTRAFDTGLAWVRFKAFNMLVGEVKANAALKGEEINATQIAAIGKLVNQLTGYTRLGPIEPAVPYINRVMFSVRLAATRVNMFNPWFYLSMPEGVQGYAVKGMAKQTALTGLVLLGAAAYGMEVVLDDPTDPGSMRIRHNDVSYDITGARTQYFTLAARLGGAVYDMYRLTRDDLNPKEMEELSKKGAPGSRFAGILTRFGLKKADPWVTALYAATMNKTVMGEPTNLRRTLLNAYRPIFLSNLHEHMNADTQGLMSGVLDFWGTPNMVRLPSEEQLRLKKLRDMEDPDLATNPVVREKIARDWDRIIDHARRERVRREQRNLAIARGERFGFAKAQQNLIKAYESLRNIDSQVELSPAQRERQAKQGFVENLMDNEE